MVTSRNTGSDATSWKINWEGYLERFGTPLTFNRITKEYDSMNREIGSSTSSSIIQADIQWVSKWNIDHMNVSDVQVGDGMLFVKIDADIQLEDEVVYSGKTYRIVEQIEGEQVGGELVYKGYSIRLNSSPE